MIYYCIPCHNEERTIGIVLWKIRQVMADFPRDYQILVADDASTDASFSVLEPYARVLPLTLMGIAQRRGYAATLEMLLREAVRRSDYPKRDAIVVLQADFTHDPEFAGALLRKLESGADIAIGEPVLGSRRKLVHRLALRLARRRAWPAEIRDPLHGFNAFRLLCVRKALEDRAQKRLLTCEGWAANAELLHAALPHARRIETVEIVTHPERLQRDSRVALLRVLRATWRFGGGGEGRPPLTPEQLVPDRTHGDRATLQAQGGPRPADATDGPDGRRDRRTAAGRGRGAQAGPGRRPPRPRPRAETPASTGESAPAQKREGESDPPAADGAPPKKRRPQRGRSGRGRRTGDRTAPASVKQEAGETGAREPPAEQPGQGGPPEPGPGSDAQARSNRPKRRRGRRGGRRRSGGGPAPGTNDANAGGQGGDPPASGGGAPPESA